MKKILLFLLVLGFSYSVFAQEPKTVEVTIQKFREIKKDLEKRKIAYKQVLTTGSRP